MHGIDGHGLDLLADGDTASSWVRSAVERRATDRGVDAPGLTLSATDVRHLRGPRTTFELLVGSPPTYGSPEGRMSRHDGPDGKAIAVPVAATLVPDSGDVMLVPTVGLALAPVRVVDRDVPIAAERHVVAPEAVPQHGMRVNVLGQFPQQQRRLARRANLRQHRESAGVPGAVAPADVAGSEP